MTSAFRVVISPSRLCTRSVALTRRRAWRRHRHPWAVEIKRALVRHCTAPHRSAGSNTRHRREAFATSARIESTDGTKDVVATSAFARGCVSPTRSRLSRFACVGETRSVPEVGACCAGAVLLATRDDASHLACHTCESSGRLRRAISWTRASTSVASPRWGRIRCRSASTRRACVSQKYPRCARQRRLCLRQPSASQSRAPLRLYRSSIVGMP